MSQYLKQIDDLSEDVKTVQGDCIVERKRVEHRERLVKNIPEIIEEIIREERERSLKKIVREEKEEINKKVEEIQSKEYIEESEEIEIKEDKIVSESKEIN